MIDLTAIDLTAETAVSLRKIAAQAGIKGASRGRKEDLLKALAPIQEEQRKAKETPAPAAPAKGMCIVCGIRRGMNAATRRANGLARDFADQCFPCYEEGSWENTHSDRGHEDGGTEDAEDCWICHPELNLAKRPAKAGRSRAGMVIIAKGTEIHKSETFRAAAEAAGWTVTISTQDYEDGDETNTRHFADAVKDGNSIQLAWNGRAYDYPNSSAQIGGKDRKVRNLKEALRLL